MKITVIKFGGEIIENVEQINNLALSVKKLHEKGEKLILIHGGGPLVTKISKQMGMTPKIVGGRRITDKDTLEVIKMVIPGITCSNILAVMKKHRVPVAAVSGISIVKAVKRPPKAVSGSNGEVVDFGWVGDVKGIDTKLLLSLLENGFIPLVSPTSCDDEGQILNINADTISFQIAGALKAQKMVAITEVGGVFAKLEDKSSRFTRLTMAEAKQKIADGVISGGMIPKVEEGFPLLLGGAESFHIVGIQTPDTLLQEITQPGSMGTAVVR